MDKQQLVVAVAKQQHITRIQSRAIIDTFLGLIQEELRKGNKVQIHNFGIFRVAHRAEHQGHNPGNLAVCTVPARNVVKFAMGTRLEEAVNGQNECSVCNDEPALSSEGPASENSVATSPERYAEWVANNKPL